MAANLCRLATCLLGLVATLTFSFGQNRPAPSTSSVAPQKSADALDKFLRGQLSQLGIPGMQVAVVQHGHLVFSRSYGFAWPRPMTALGIGCWLSGILRSH
ncbi:hypothetical protein [Spirosoma pollinicola]|uniref:hypothetical protein n=1 Tax=Spirosoma pollinicola TaxID=2057025 RepID=UPI00197CD637|nr:hypothetical protein [Spirosoma pollinicola]